MKTLYRNCSAGPEALYAGGMNADGAVRDLAPLQYPLERLLEMGPAVLTDAELLSIILDTENRDKRAAAIADELMGLLDAHADIPPVKELAAIPGLGTIRAGMAAAVLEFGRRRWGRTGFTVKTPGDIFALVRQYSSRRQESFICVSLNGAHETLGVRVLTTGLVNKTMVHPREVFADLIEDRASAFAVAHNHPSGNLQPSPSDDEITLTLFLAAEILGLHFMDHVIFSETEWWSFREHGNMPN